jgi:hypothetical protein
MRLVGSGADSIPVFRGLRATSVKSGSQGTGLVSGLPNAAFVVEGAILRNTDNTHGMFSEVCYEKTEFIADHGEARIGLGRNGPVSIIDCIFRGFSFGLKATQSDSNMFFAGRTSRTAQPAFICDSNLRRLLVAFLKVTRISHWNGALEYSSLRGDLW